MKSKIVNGILAGFVGLGAFYFAGQDAPEISETLEPVEGGFVRVVSYGESSAREKAVDKFCGEQIPKLTVSVIYARERGVSFQKIWDKAVRETEGQSRSSRKLVLNFVVSAYRSKGNPKAVASVAEMRCRAIFDNEVSY